MSNAKRSFITTISLLLALITRKILISTRDSENLIRINNDIKAIVVRRLSIKYFNLLITKISFFNRDNDFTTKEIVDIIIFKFNDF